MLENSLRCPKCNSEIVQDASKPPPDNYYCENCKIFIKEGDNLPEKSSEVPIKKRAQKPQKTPRKKADKESSKKTSSKKSSIRSTGRGGIFDGEKRGTGVLEHYKPNKLVIEGFRGFNGSLSLNFEKPVCILFGGSGTGKTSTLEAEQWVLNENQMDFYDDGEFKNEDSIVNKNSEEVKVEVTLSNNSGAQLVISRARKKAKKSIPPPSFTRTIKINKEKLDYDKSFSQISQLLNLDLNEYNKIIHLHQYSLNKLIYETSEGGMVIEHLFGIATSEDLIKIIESYWRKTGIRVNKLKKDKEVLEKELELEKQHEFLLGEFKEKFEKLKTEKFVKNEDEIIPEFLISKMNPFIDSINRLIKELKLNIQEVGKDLKDLKSIRNTIDGIKDIIDVLASEISQSELKEWMEQKSKILQIKTELGVILENIKKKEDLEKSLIEKGKIEPDKSIQNQIQEIQDEIDRLSALRPKIQEYHEVSSKLKPLEIENQAIKLNYDDKLAEYDKILDQIARIDKEIEGQNLLVRIKMNSINHLRGTQKNICPVCEGEIDIPRTIEKLESSLKHQDSHSNLRFLEEDKRQFLLMKSQVENELKKFQNTEEAITRYIRQRDSLAEEILTEIELPIPEIKKLDLILSDKNLKKFELEHSYSDDKKLTEQLDSIKSELSELRKQKERKMDELKQFKISDIKQIEEQVKEITQKISHFEKNTRDIQNQINQDRREIEKFELLYDLLKYRDTSKTTEKTDTVSISQQIKNIEEQITLGDDFTSFLKEIKEIMHSSKSEFMDSRINKISDTIDNYYKRLIGHPLFNDFYLKSDLKSKKSKYFFKSKTKDQDVETNIQTTLSQGQINLTAISIFLALALTSLEEHKLGLIVLDGPAQHLDSEQKQKLAELIAEISSELSNQNVLIQIATSDRLFFEALKSKFDLNSLQVFHFHDWDAKGPKIECRN